MTFTESPYVVFAVLSLALFGVWFLGRHVAWEAGAQAVAWWRDRRESLSDEDGCSDPPAESCSDVGCPVHGWPENDLEELPSERSREELGFTGPIIDPWPWIIEAQERRMPPYEAEYRAVYEALGFDYPSGLMARVREAAP